MVDLKNGWNTISRLILLWLFVSYFASIVNAFQRYPCVLPKCCEPDGSSSSNGISRKSNGGSNRNCGGGGLEHIHLPKQLFPGMSTNAEHVEVKLNNLLDGLQCEDGFEGLETLIDLTHVRNMTPVKLGRKKSFDGVAFSGDNLLASDGNIYAPPNFCISSRSTNKTQLVFKTCKQTCSPESPCIPRCCGGHQSLLSSLPTFANESFLDFCSSPTMESESWNPWTSEILSVSNRTRFHQVKYFPRNLGNSETSVVQENCQLLAYTDTKMTLLEDGRLAVWLVDRTKVMEDFCIDGMNSGKGTSSPGATGDKCESAELREVVFAYVCFTDEIPSIPEPQLNEDNAISLPACSCLATPSDRLIESPLNYDIDGRTLFPKPLVKLTTGLSLDCPEGYEDFTVEYDNEKPPRSQHIFVDGSLLMTGSHYFFGQDMFCIRSVFDNALTIRVCKERENPWKRAGYFQYIAWYAGSFALFLSPLFYGVIAVIYILRNDKELVLRCGTICYTISMAIHYVVFICKGFILPQVSYLVKHFILEILMIFFSKYTFAWMCALSFDLWLTITFHRSGNNRVKWFWGYVVITLTTPLVNVCIFLMRVERFIDPRGILSEWLGHFAHVLGYGILAINMVLFLATAGKLWIDRHSSVRPQIKTFLYYSKLLILVLFDSVLEFLVRYLSGFRNNYYYLAVGLAILMFLHPILSFFLLVWNEETKKFLTTNYPGVKRVLDFINGIGYPVRKCLEFCRRCTLRQDGRTDGDEILLCSSDETRF